MKVSYYKNRIIEQLITDSDISQALLNKKSNFLTSVPTLTEKLSLKKKNVFPYFLADKTQDMVESYIFVEFKFDYNEGGYTSDVTIDFKIFVHKDLIDTDEGESRIDFISERIKEIFNRESKGFNSKLHIMTEGNLPSYKDKYIVNRLVFGTVSIT